MHPGRNGLLERLNFLVTIQSDKKLVNDMTTNSPVGGKEL
jgi:hypothetical protein